MLQTRPAPSSPMPIPPAPDGAEPEDPLLTFAGSVAGAHALVLGRDCGLLCGLIRHGCAAAAVLRSTERPEAGAYDLALAPRLAAHAELDRVAAQARRALAPTGRFVARLQGEAAPELARLLARCLALHGFAPSCTRALGAAVLVRADLPLFHAVMGAA